MLHHGRRFQVAEGFEADLYECKQADKTAKFTYSLRGRDEQDDRQIFLLLKGGLGRV